MSAYTVKQLSRLANVSIRTLHYYDRINLLKPTERKENGYRIYSEKELLQLQQILFFKELGFSLKEIFQFLNDPDFNMSDALIYQRKELLHQNSRIEQLILTIDKTLEKLRKENSMLSDKELYEGFEKGQEYKQEAIERWGKDRIKETEDLLKKLSKKEFDLVKKRGEEITMKFVILMDKAIDSKDVQTVVNEHYNYLKNYYEPNLEMYSGLGKLYVDDHRFKNYYDNYSRGLAEFINKAIQHYCKK